MDLHQYWGKKVELEDIDGIKFIGNIDFYSDEINDPDGKENITLNNGKELINFYSDEIKTIKVI